MTKLSQFPPGVRHDIRRNRRRDRRRILARHGRTALETGRRIAGNNWFVALVGGILAGLAVAWLLLYLS